MFQVGWIAELVLGAIFVVTVLVAVIVVFSIRSWLPRIMS